MPETSSSKEGVHSAGGEMFDDVVVERLQRAGADVLTKSVFQLAKELRLKLAVNLFKRYLLGSEHVAGDPQVERMLQTVLGSRLFEFIELRTWVSWFGQSPSIPKRRTIRELDRVAEEGIRYVYATGHTEYRLPSGFFEGLVYGGLISKMASVGRSKRLRSAINEAVSEYVPLSAWHLHMDAVEVSALAEGLGDLDWIHIKQLAAKRLMSLLLLLWGPRDRIIYEFFASDLRLKWLAASAGERELIQRDRSVYSWSSFIDSMAVPPVPAWSFIGVESDLAEVHIHKALLAIAGDIDFLKAERLHAWAFDLASAGLVMHALAWTDRYTTFGLRVQSERLCWMTLSTMFFDLHEEWDDRNLKATMDHLCIPWSSEVEQSLLAGRASYMAEIHALGLDVASLIAVARHATDVHKLTYHQEAVDAREVRLSAPA